MRNTNGGSNNLQITFILHHTQVIIVVQQLLSDKKGAWQQKKT